MSHGQQEDVAHSPTTLLSLSPTGYTGATIALFLAAILNGKFYLIILNIGLDNGEYHKLQIFRSDTASRHVDALLQAVNLALPPEVHLHSIEKTSNHRC